MGTNNEKAIKRYSEAFKIKVVEKIIRGKLTIAQAYRVLITNLFLFKLNQIFAINL